MRWCIARFARASWLRRVRAFRQQVQLAEPQALPKPICRDADDDLVLATAVGAGATMIVTGDDDLLVLRSYSGIEIVTPRHFLERLDADS